MPRVHRLAPSPSCREGFPRADSTCGWGEKEAPKTSPVQPVSPGLTATPHAGWVMTGSHTLTHSCSFIRSLYLFTNGLEIKATECFSHGTWPHTKKANNLAGLERLLPACSLASFPNTGHVQRQVACPLA